jgi:outer membrane cobalamin receptor
VLVAPNAVDSVDLPGNHLLRRPVNSGNVMLNASVRRFSFTAAGYFTGARTDSDFDGFGLTRNPGYSRFDLATSYDVRRGFSVYGRATNLLNKQYQDALGYPALGRDFRLGVNYRFSGRD